MRNQIGGFLTAAVIGILATVSVGHHGAAQPEPSEPPQRLAVVWTSGDPDVAHRMVLMYVHAAQRGQWFDENRLIVWGPSARLLAGDKDLQAKIKEMMADGVQVEACVACADSYGVSDQLRALGLPVRPMGKPLSEYIQTGYHVLTF